MKRRRWLAVPIVLVVIALVGGLLNMTVHISGRVPGAAYTLEGVERCATGSLSLERFDCDPSLKPSCSQTPSDAVTLRWDGQESTVGRMGPAPGVERPISVKRRDTLLRDFATLGHTPDDTGLLEVPPLRAFFVVRGKCVGRAIAPSEVFLGVALLPALRAAPIEDAPALLELSLRGAGPRAEKLFSRIDRLAR